MTRVTKAEIASENELQPRDMFFRTLSADAKLFVRFTFANAKNENLDRGARSFSSVSVVCRGVGGSEMHRAAPGDPVFKSFIKPR